MVDHYLNETDTDSTEPKKPDRTDCPMQRKNGKCLVAGAFSCTDVGDDACSLLHAAYNAGWCDCVRYIFREQSREGTK